MDRESTSVQTYPITVNQLLIMNIVVLVAKSGARQNKFALMKPSNAVQLGRQIVQPKVMLV